MGSSTANAASGPVIAITGTSGAGKGTLEQEDEFDYVVVNDDVSRAADELLGIVQRELETAGSMSAP